MRNRPRLKCFKNVQAVDFSDDASIESAKNLLEGANELGCPIGADSPGVEPNPEFEEEGD